MTNIIFSNYKRYYFRKLCQFCFRILTIFIPVQKNRILIICFGGRQYACNPKYIVEYLYQTDKERFEIIVSIANPSLKKIVPRWMKTTRQYSLLFCYYYMSAKVIISNDSPIFIIPKKGNQLIINTWHGGGAYKRVGKAIDNGNTKQISHKQRRFFNQNTSAYISSSMLFTKYHISESNEYNGIILNTGMPRNDVFFYNQKQQHEIKIKVYQFFNIDISNRIILYAPTIHDNSYTNNITNRGAGVVFENYWLDAKKLEEYAHERFGGNWVVVIRAHVGRKSFVADTMDASDYPDMQELLIASDILISDYSSTIWDFSFTYKPCFLYCYDLERYDKERGFYLPIYEWGFPVCETFSALLDAIRTFDENDFHTKMKKHHEQFGSYENGHARERVVNYILQQIG